MPKLIKIEVTRLSNTYRMIVYVDNKYYTEHRSKDPKKILIDAHEYLTADIEEHR